MRLGRSVGKAIGLAGCVDVSRARGEGISPSGHCTRASEGRAGKP